MGERKVLNKYFPPDFDPSKLAKAGRSREEQWKVRMMLPMSVRCLTCGQYMYKGTKFNTRMETLQNEDYLGFKIYRFYFKCQVCGSEFTLKTDPQNTDYTVESGAKRNFEPWRAEEKVNDQMKSEREEDIKNDTMKELEYKTRDSKMEMDVMQALDNQKLLNSKNQKIRIEDMMAMLKDQEKVEFSKQEDNDEILEEDQKRLRELQKSGVFKFKSINDQSLYNIQNSNNQKQKSKGNGTNNGVEIRKSTLQVKIKPKRLQHEDSLNEDKIKKQRLPDSQIIQRVLTTDAKPDQNLIKDSGASIVNSQTKEEVTQHLISQNTIIQSQHQTGDKASNPQHDNNDRKDQNQTLGLGMLDYSSSE